VQTITQVDPTTEYLCSRAIATEGLYEIYLVPRQGNFSEALPAQAKIKVLRSLYNELDKSRGRERSSDGRLCQAEGPTIEKALCYLMAGCA